MTTMDDGETIRQAQEGDARLNTVWLQWILRLVAAACVSLLLWPLAGATAAAGRSPRFALSRDEDLFWPEVSGVTRWVAAAATVVVAAIDGAGNTLFLRAVRPLERAEMTAVFMTYRDAAQLSVPGLCALMLLVAPLPAVFLVSGLATGALALLARFIPRRM